VRAKTSHTYWTFKLKHRVVLVVRFRSAASSASCSAASCSTGLVTVVSFGEPGFFTWLPLFMPTLPLPNQFGNDAATNYQIISTIDMKDILCYHYCRDIPVFCLS